MAVLAGIGALAILGQVVLLRELLVALYGSELIYLLAFADLLLATALGVWFGGRMRRPVGSDLPYLLLGLALAVPSLTVLARGTHPLLGGVPGGYLPVPLQLLSLAAVLAPFGLLAGVLFQRASVGWVRAGHDLATAYALDSAGGLAGGLAATLLAATGSSNLEAALSCGLGAAGLCAWAAWSKRHWGIGVAAALLVAALAALAFDAAQIDRRTTVWQHPQVRAMADTPYGRVAVAVRAGQTAVLVNGALSYDSQDAGAEVLAHLAALQVAAPRRVLVLGDNSYAVVPQLLEHRPERLDLVLVDQQAYRLVATYLPPAQAAALAAAAVQLHFADPRRFLAAPGIWDLIVVAAGEPESGRVNRLYTRDFYALCRTRLSPGGVLAFQLEAAENLWSPALLRRTATILRAVSSAFADVLLLPGDTVTLLASDRPLSRSAQVLAQRWHERVIHASLVEPGYIEYLLADERGPAAQALLTATAVPLNTDARPSCYPQALVLWLSRFFPRLGVWRWSAGAAGTAAIAGLLMGLWVAALWWARHRPGCGAAGAVATAGFVGMLYQSVLLLHYQTLSGVLYQDLGLLITASMAGLTGGSLLVNGLCRRQPLPVRWQGTAVVGGTVLLCLVGAWLIRSGISLGLAGCCGLLLAGGFEVGGLFAWASRRPGTDHGGAVAPLYAADLLGGCAAAVAGTVVLIPAMGLDGALLVGAVLAAGLWALV